MEWPVFGQYESPPHPVVGLLAERWALERGYYDAKVLAAVNWLLDVVQMPLMLRPPPIKKAAEANATNDIRSVYSIRS